MLRTQIYLPEELSQELKLLAYKEGKPTAVIIRKLLKTGLVHQQKKRKNAGQVLLDLAALGKKLKVKGPKDLSSNFFDYAYGKKSSYAKR